jgi:hypothetical protein
LDGAKNNFHILAVEIKCMAMADAVHGERREESAEEQDLGHEKNPHARSRSLALLLRRGKLLAELQNG